MYVYTKTNTHPWSQQAAEVWTEKSKYVNLVFHKAWRGVGGWEGGWWEIAPGRGEVEGRGVENPKAPKNVIPLESDLCQEFVKN